MINQDQDINLVSYLRDNDFTEDFLKGNVWDVPGELNKPRYYVF